MTAEREGLAEIAGVVTAALPDECWTTQHSTMVCTDMIGAGFPNQQKWTEDMCCVPCRVRAALTSPALADLLAARDRQVRAEALRAASKMLHEKAAREFDIKGPFDPRGAGIWDSAAYLVLQADRIEADR